LTIILYEFVYIIFIDLIITVFASLSSPVGWILYVWVYVELIYFCLIEL